MIILGQVGIRNDKNEVVLELKYDVIQKITENVVQAILGDVIEVYTKDLKQIYTGSGMLFLHEDYIKIQDKEDMIYLNVDRKRNV